MSLTAQGTDIFSVAARYPSRAVRCPRCKAGTVSFGWCDIEFRGYSTRAHCVSCEHTETGNNAEDIFLRWTAEGPRLRPRARAKEVLI